MKKMIFILMLFFLGITIANAERVTDQFEYIFMWRYHYVDSNGKFGDFQIFKRKSDGKIAYCIEPGVSLSSEDYDGLFNLSEQELATHVGLTTSQLERISLYSFFGYGYGDHTNSEWIVAVQAKIWQLLGRDFQFTSRNSEANPWAYVIDTPSEIQEKMNELDRLINEYYSKPDIDNNHYSLMLGESFEIKDDSIKSYKLKTTSNDIQKKEDSIIITPSKVGNYTVSLEKEEDVYSQPFIVYHNDAGQDLMLSGNVKNKSISFTYEVTDKKIKIIKKDKDTKENILLANIKFKLFDIKNNKYICENTDCTFSTNNQGEILIDNLYYSTYRLEEVQNKYDDYVWNQETIEIDINKDSNEITVIEFFNKKVKGQISITKVNEEDIPLKDIEFQIYAKEDIYENNILLYNKDELIETIITNELGLATSSLLPLGNYYIIESTRLDSLLPNNNIYDVSLEYLDELTEVIKTDLTIVNYKVPETYKNKDISFITLSMLGIGFLLYEKKKYIFN